MIIAEICQTCHGNNPECEHCDKGLYILCMECRIPPKEKGRIHDNSMFALMTDNRLYQCPKCKEIEIIDIMPIVVQLKHS